ncbi:uncharacterized protein LOC111486643 [Cucurbita maxima]|uniref:Uncharacterized protein LOC111486643 n=1 Tax=Cucurbita maxima TaxID=3661 RepID=A0A6J1JPT9_CUCMA|nr:uncharacterized protein LOC111486643 [Cucurbita maxima]
MGKSESAKECKRHPNHRLLPGICPSCLRESLQRFNNQSSIYSDSASTFSSSSSSFPHSSEFFFSGDSPRRTRHHHKRNASEMVMRSRAADLFGDKLKMSGEGGKKKGGFWSRLMGGRKAFHFHSQPKVSCREIIG